MKKSFIKCLLKVSFRVQKNPQQCKTPNKVIPCKI